MSNKDMLNNALSLTKSLITLEVNATIEASNKDMKSFMTSAVLVNLELQEDLFNKMSKLGFYKTDKVKKEDGKKLYKKLKGNE